MIVKPFLRASEIPFTCENDPKYLMNIKNQCECHNLFTICMRFNFRNCALNADYVENTGFLLWRFLLVRNTVVNRVW